jgi:chromosome segregation ATPase
MTICSPWSTPIKNKSSYIPLSPDSPIAAAHQQLSDKCSKQNNELLKTQRAFTRLYITSKKSHEEMNKRLSDSQDEADSLRNELLQVRMQLEETLIHFKQASDKADVLYGQLIQKQKELNQKNIDLTERVKKAEDALPPLQEKYNELEQNFRSLNSKFLQATQENQELQNEKQELQSIINNSIETKIKTNYNKIIDLISKLTTKIYLFILALFDSISQYCVFRKS